MNDGTLVLIITIAGIAIVWPLTYVRYKSLLASSTPLEGVDIATLFLWLFLGAMPIAGMVCGIVALFALFCEYLAKRLNRA